MELNLGWLLTIAILPFPTEMIGAFPSERFTKGLYIGTMLASSILQAAMVLTIRGNENLSVSPNSITDRWRADAIGTPVALAIALVVATVFPDVGYYAIVLVALVPQLARLRYGSRE
jgi:uncharacterized membrane protein